MSKEKKKIKRTLARKILNSIIGIVGVLVILLILFIGYMQTSSFRNWLREEIVETVNSSINGKLSIGQIRGTLLSSVYLDDLNLSFENDTVISAKTIGIKANPFELLFSRVYLREVIMYDVNLKIVEDSLGATNFSRLFSADSTKEATEETDESEPFAFTILVNNLEFRNLDLIRKTYEYRNTKKNYLHFNPDDLRITELNIKAKLVANLKQQEARLVIDDLTGNPNLSRFKLNEFNGGFTLTRDFAEVNYLNLKTNFVDLSVKARMDSLNLFGDIDLLGFENYPIKLDFRAENYNFADLSSFLDDTEFLKGSASLNLKAEGYFGDLDIKELNLDYNNTHFEIFGHVKNLHQPDKLFLDVNIVNSRTDYSDVLGLLPELELPRFDDIRLEDMHFSYKGEPTKFKTVGFSKVGKGEIIFDCYLDLQQDDLEYDITYETKKIDLFPVIGEKSSVTAKGSLKGKGTSVEILATDFQTTVSNSFINDYKIDHLELSASAFDRLIDFKMEGTINNAISDIKGNFDFADLKNPGYKFDGKLNQLNLEEFITDSLYNTNLNFDFVANGKYLDIDKMIGELKVDLDSSSIRSEYIYGDNLNISLAQDSGIRTITIESDFLDFIIFGDYKISTVIDLIMYESKTISEIISNKLQDFTLADDSLKLEETIPEIAESEFDLNFTFNFKDFSLFRTLLNNKELDLAGSGKGEIKNSASSFEITTELDIEHFLTISGEELIYVNDLKTDFHFTRDNRLRSFEALFGSVSLSTDKIIYGSEYHDIFLDLIFNESKLYYNLSAAVNEDLNASGEGTISMTSNSQSVFVDAFKIDYKNVIWENQEQLVIDFDASKISFDSFKLMHREAEAAVTGFIMDTGQIDVEVEVNNMPGMLLTFLATDVSDSEIGGDVKLTAKITGTTESPLIDFDLNMEKMSYSGVTFGTLMFSSDYSNRLITTNAIFVDSTHSFENPLLKLIGTIPIDLKLGDIENRIPDDSEIDMQLISKGFDFTIFGNTLPFITEQRGNIFADIAISGDLSNIITNGTFKLENGNFKVRDNNLYYNAEFEIEAEESNLNFKNITIQNSSGSNYSGTLRGNGNIEYSNEGLEQIQIIIRGDLAVLSPNSKSVSPELFGDLVIDINDKAEFTYDDDRFNLIADILLKEVDLTFTLNQTGVTRSGEGFVYEIIEDSLNIDRAEAEIENLISEFRLAAGAPSRVTGSIPFDYSLLVTIENEASLIFILNKSIAQRLVVKANGDLQVRSKYGLSDAQGGFTLLDGSRLEFFKSFDATGSIRFESNLYDPYLNISAKYIGDYVAPNNENESAKRVAVKLSLNGTLSSLSKNLALDENRLTVYVGEKNIQSEIPSMQYDASDAMSFILVGRFKNDLTSGDKISVAEQAGAAASFFGPVVSSFLNSAVGNIIDDVQISQSGKYTRIGISGRHNNFRYKIGGTTEAFNDMRKANILIQYLFNRNISLRYERKNPVIYYEGNDLKIDELGLRYRFEF